MKTQAIELVTSAARAAFWTEFNQMPDRIGSIAYRIASDMKIESYAWLGDAPNVREWVGNRVHKGVPELSFTITNKLWESTLDFDFFTISSPAGGAQATVRGRQMGNKAATHPYRLALSLLEANPTCYDSVAFYATTHKDPGANYTTNQSNAITVTGMTSTTAPSAFDMLTCVRAIHNYFLTVKDGEGDEAFGDSYLSIKPIVICHPSYITSLNQVAVNDQITSGTVMVGNDCVGTFTPVVSNRLTAVATSAFIYAIAPNSPRSAFIYQEHSPVSLTDNASSVLAGEVPDLSMRAAGAWNVGVGDWRCSARILLT